MSMSTRMIVEMSTHVLMNVLDGSYSINAHKLLLSINQHICQFSIKMHIDRMLLKKSLLVEGFSFFFSTNEPITNSTDINEKLNF